MRCWWFCPLLILLSVGAVDIVMLVSPHSVVYHTVLFWFLCVCPGLVLVRFLHIQDMALLWSLALALSLSLDSIIASIQLYVHLWSPVMTLTVLIYFCCVGSLFQLLFSTRLWMIGIATHK